MSTRVCFFTNSSWNLFNFRRGLIKAIQSQGHEVVAIAPTDEYADRLPCLHHHIPLAHHGLDPIEDIATYRNVRKKLQELRPDILLNYTIKPNVYGALAGHALNIPTINNVSGLGTIFIKDNWATSPTVTKGYPRNVSKLSPAAACCSWTIFGPYAAMVGPSVAE